LNNLKFLEECIVDADNIFTVRGIHFKISPLVEEYRVFNSYKNTEDFTNESEMSIVKVFINRDNLNLVFLNEKNQPITKLMIVEDDLL
jgi:hypothetical protein